MSIVIVSATRFTEEEFKTKSWLGKSLDKLKGFTREIAYENYEGLPTVYNRAITKYLASKKPLQGILFVHDDVRLEDLFLQDKLCSGWKVADVLGVAGSAKFSLQAPAWPGDGKDLAGAVWHPINDKGQIACASFGASPSQCIVLDGLFLAVKKEVLVKGVRFDERFLFHHYDLDFCLTCNQEKLMCCTVPIHLVHGSAGDYGSEAWNSSAHTFVQKWAAPSTVPVKDTVIEEPSAELINKVLQNCEVHKLNNSEESLPSASLSSYVCLLQKDTVISAVLYEELSQLMAKGVDIGVLQPRLLKEGFIKEETADNAYVMSLVKEDAALAYYSLTAGYECWTTLDNVLIKSSVYEEFLNSAYYKKAVADKQLTSVGLLFSVWAMATGKGLVTAGKEVIAKNSEKRISSIPEVAIE